MTPIFDWLDRSPRLKDLIKWLSTTLAAKRGLPLIGAIAFTIISLVVHIVAALSGSVFLGICGMTILHLGIIIGFLGVLLAEPLGRG
jgi:hypothetical protein